MRTLGMLVLVGCGAAVETSWTERQVAAARVLSARHAEGVCGRLPMGTTGDDLEALAEGWSTPAFVGPRAARCRLGLPDPGPAVHRWTTVPAWVGLGHAVVGEVARRDEVGLLPPSGAVQAELRARLSERGGPAVRAWAVTP